MMKLIHLATLLIFTCFFSYAEANDELISLPDVISGSKDIDKSTEQLIHRCVAANIYASARDTQQTEKASLYFQNANDYFELSKRMALSNGEEFDEMKVKKIQINILYQYEAMEKNLKTVSQKEFDDFLMNDLATCMLYKQILTDVGKNKAGAS